MELAIDQNGSNLSQGQKQLICIARALVERPKILLMDEATANIDEKTDSLVQEVVGAEFCGSTVVTIAHRLKTIIQYDRILVLDLGRCMEEGAPYEMLQNEKSYFRALVKENGEEFYQEMLELAKKKYHSD